MMSLSDTEKDHPTRQDRWKALDINSLENVGSNDSRTKGKNDPEYLLFKTLYDDPGMAEKERFVSIHGAGKGVILSGDQFKALDTDGGKKEISDISLPRSVDPEISDKSGTSSNSMPGVPPDSPPDSPEKETQTPDFFELIEQAKKEGYDRGFDLGQKEGYDKGVEQGLAEGEKQGYPKGFERGETEARALQDEKAQALIASLETILLKTEGTWEDLVKRYEGKMIALIARIAEKVVQARVKLDKGVVRASIIHALGQLPEPEEIVLQVSEEDYEYIDMIKEDFFEQIKSLTSISVVANSGVKRGGCKIESRTARVETDVESRLQAVLDAILEQGV
ncbi:FliH [Desulforapulum autotrophicum HRM2]|uniref:Flagellar assembly protein FliH n=1 Tax=Desulforapulum autotrophicum (strain ATCC 43914 / DSM 3382 / VKM B-1955 / HRM2) TaxID=177437 RepID=C0QAK2_DESAH|nr:FliH [Desulforapulum autotrophicum HRM2]